MKITPVRGTRDFLPEEVRLRDYLKKTILKSYCSCGFERIDAPMLEDIENLNTSEGGENLSLMFQVLKRGEKLTAALEKKEYNKLSDIGLRYDLTLPLARYYANNRATLPKPFKCIQMDRAFRAERPQKGRYREFIQCDIDILGTDSVNAEIELIDVTAKALMAIGIKGFTVRVNDRRILRSIISAMGFAESEIDSVCVSYDKLDKIGADGVAAELNEKGLASNATGKFVQFMKEDLMLENSVRWGIPEERIVDLKRVIETVTSLSNGRYGIQFDQSLVRGQGYYTGMVFEIVCPVFGASIAGGGRYDNMIGKFIGERVPAVGFSIGFERISDILQGNHYQFFEEQKRAVVVYECEEDIVKAIAFADSIRDTCDAAIAICDKNVGKMLSRFQQQGFSEVYLPEGDTEWRRVSIKEHKE